MNCEPRADLIPIRDGYLVSETHLGKMPAFPFYGGPPCNPDMLARGSVAELIADLDGAGVERALGLPNYGVPGRVGLVRLQSAGPGGGRGRRPDPVRAVGLAAAAGRRAGQDADRGRGRLAG